MIGLEPKTSRSALQYHIHVVHAAMFRPFKLMLANRLIEWR